MTDTGGNGSARNINNPKNAAIFLLLLIAVIMGVLLAKNFTLDRSADTAQAPNGDAVSVVEVRYDDRDNRFIDIVFNKPLGKGKEGEVLGRDPVSVSPTVSGSWIWKSAGVLRFEPSGRFRMASDYTLNLVPENLLEPGQKLRGKTEFQIRTDGFKVEQSTVEEEPVTDKKNTVTLNGTIRFNYPVDPAVLARKISLIEKTPGAEDKEIPVKLQTDYWNSVIRWKSAPITKEKDERELELVIVGDLKPAEGNVPIGSDFVDTIPVGSKDKLSVRSAKPQARYPVSSIEIKFSSAVSPDVAAGYISIEPPVKYRVSKVSNNIVLKGGFQPGSAYKLSVSKGLPAVDDAVLLSDFEKELRFSNLDPEVEFSSRGMFLDSKGTQAVELKSINVKQIDLTVDRVYLNNLFYLFQSYGYSVWRDEYYRGAAGDYYGSRITQKKDIKIQSKKNEQVSTVLDIKQYIPPGETGLYQIGIVPAGQYEGVQKWLLITDLGIVAKKGKDDFLVWVSSFSDLKPVSRAKINIISGQNQVIASGISDIDGILHIDHTQEAFGGQEPYMITVEKGGDFSFLLLDRMEIDTSGLDVGGGTLSQKGYSAYVYGERDIYRPGETVEGVAAVRDSSLKTPVPMPVVLKQKDPRGRVVKTIKEETNSEGLISFSLPIAEYAPTGYHAIEIFTGDELIGTYRYQVEEFIPDRIRVRIDPDKDDIPLSQELAYEVSSAYLFGPPASDLSVESSVDIVARPFLPEGYKGYVFTNPDRKFDSREIFKAEGRLNEEGLIGFSTEMPSGLRPPSSLQAQITARVRESGGRGVTARRSVNIDPYPYYLGLKRAEPDRYADPGEEVEFEYVALIEQGRDAVEARAGTLRAELFKDEWNTVLRKTPSGNYKYESKRDSILTDSKTVEGGSGEGSFVFTPPEFGSYRVTLTDPEGGASTQIQFYVSGSGYSPWAVENPARVELDIEKKEYMPGEQARVQVRAPFPGRLLISVERDNIFYTETRDLTGNTAVISIPVKEEYRPNAYITATLIRSVKDIEPGSVGRAYGAAPLNVDKSGNKIDVEITAPEQIRPMSSLDIEVKTLPGAMVTVAAVDEGILQLIDQKTADPFKFFYRKLALGISAFDTFSLLLPDVEIESSPPGGGFSARKEMQFLSTQGIRRVKPVTFWSGIRTADEEGNLTLAFDVPQFQGALRIMAVAVKGEKFGSGERFTKVKSPIVILPTVPRFFSVQESVIIPVSVRNDTKRDGVITVNMSLKGPASVSEYKVGQAGSGEKTLAKEAGIKVEIPDGREKTVYFEIVTIDNTGKISINTAASGNGESTTTVIEAPVLADLPPSRVENVGRIVSQDTQIIIVDKDSYRPGTLNRELYISRLPLIEFSGKLDNLLAYPYGCLEQVVSRVFALIYLPDIARELDPGVFKESDPEALVQEGIRRVGSMQIAGGGFSLWPGGGVVESWASIYAAHFLVESRRAGFYVEDSLYSGALRYLESESKAEPTYSTGELERAVYALYVLSRDGRADLSAMDFIRERHIGELTVVSRALLGGAYAASGDAASLEELLSGLDDVEQVERQTGGNFNSTIRNRAIFLLAILDVNPDDPRVPALVERLSRDAELNSLWTTQESSFALLAIGQFMKKQAEAPPFKGAVYLGAKKLADFDSDKTLSLTGIGGSEPISIKMEEGYGGGSAYYSLITRGTPTRKGFKPLQDGLIVERLYLDRNGAPVDPQNIEQSELIVIQTKIKSTDGHLQNVVIENLLPSGFEVENPRLKTTETLKWATGNKIKPGYLDIRDDRILVFTDLPDSKWYNYYALIRAVNPGTFNVPPVQAEAMYSPNIRFTGELENPIQVRIRNFKMTEIDTAQ